MAYFPPAADTEAVTTTTVQAQMALNQSKICNKEEDNQYYTPVHQFNDAEFGILKKTSDAKKKISSQFQF